jgi:hypothetical protein
MIIAFKSTFVVGLEWVILLQNEGGAIPDD